VIHPTAKCCWCASSLIRDDKGIWWCQTRACQDRQRGRYAVWHPGQKKYLYVPTPRQVEWHEAVYRRDLTRLLVGGHAGPGKSRWLREQLYRLAFEVPGFHALLLRRTHPDLQQSHLKFVPKEVADRGGRWKVSDKVIEFDHPGNVTSVIRMGHLEDVGALQNYLSSEYDVIAPDELVTFDKESMLELFSRARSTNEALYRIRGGFKFWAMNEDDELEEMETDGSMVLTATNPAGRGGLWVKDFFIDKTPDPSEHASYQPERWHFESAELRDNPYIKRAYVATLQDLPEIRRRQLLLGDWNAFEGQFFSGFSARTHAVALSLARPLHGVVEACDWGFSSFGCVGWFVSVGDHHWHCLGEWKFKGLTAEEVAQGIKERRQTYGIESVAYTVVDPSMFNKTGHGQGESIAETFARYGVPCRRGHNDRKMGWPRLAAAFKTAPDGRPWLTFDPEECKYLLRSIPSLMQDEHDPEDVDSDMDDHGADMCRYWAMSRPMWKVEPPQEPPAKPNTWAFWRQWHAQREQPRGVLA
jgi:phage terminase large subunit